jgi:hypothetical protein
MPDGTITRRPFIGVALLGLTGCGQATLTITPQPRVFFIAPTNNADVPSRVTVRLGVEGYSVRPAGDTTAGTGHHHLLINRVAIAAGQPIPFDDYHKHLGMGQEEIEVDLRPGLNILTAQFADGGHRAIAGMTATIQVNVPTIG